MKLFNIFPSLYSLSSRRKLHVDESCKNEMASLYSMTAKMNKRTSEMKSTPEYKLKDSTKSHENSQAWKETVLQNNHLLHLPSSHQAINRYRKDAMTHSLTRDKLNCGYRPTICCKCKTSSVNDTERTTMRNHRMDNTVPQNENLFPIVEKAFSQTAGGKVESNSNRKRLSETPSECSWFYHQKPCENTVLAKEDLNYHQKLDAKYSYSDQGVVKPYGNAEGKCDDFNQDIRYLSGRSYYDEEQQLNRATTDSTHLDIARFCISHELPMGSSFLERIEKYDTSLQPLPLPGKHKLKIIPESHESRCNVDWNRKAFINEFSDSQQELLLKSDNGFSRVCTVSDRCMRPNGMIEGESSILQNYTRDESRGQQPIMSCASLSSIRDRVMEAEAQRNTKVFNHQPKLSAFRSVRQTNSKRNRLSLEGSVHIGQNFTDKKYENCPRFKVINRSSLSESLGLNDGLDDSKIDQKQCESKNVALDDDLPVFKSSGNLMKSCRSFWNNCFMKNVNLCDRLPSIPEDSVCGKCYADECQEILQLSPEKSADPVLPVLNASLPYSKIYESCDIGGKTSNVCANLKSHQEDDFAKPNASQGSESLPERPAFNEDVEVHVKCNYDLFGPVQETFPSKYRETEADKSDFDDLTVNEMIISESQETLSSGFEVNFYPSDTSISNCLYDYSSTKYTAGTSKMSFPAKYSEQMELADETPRYTAESPINDDLDCVGKNPHQKIMRLDNEFDGEHFSDSCVRNACQKSVSIDQLLYDVCQKISDLKITDATEASNPRIEISGENVESVSESVAESFYTIPEEFEMTPMIVEQLGSTDAPIHEAVENNRRAVDKCDLSLDLSLIGGEADSECRLSVSDSSISPYLGLGYKSVNSSMCAVSQQIFDQTEVKVKTIDTIDEDENLTKYSLTQDTSCAKNEGDCQKEITNGRRLSSLPLPVDRARRVDRDCKWRGGCAGDSITDRTHAAVGDSDNCREENGEKCPQRAKSNEHFDFAHNSLETMEPTNNRNIATTNRRGKSLHRQMTTQDSPQALKPKLSAPMMNSAICPGAKWRENRSSALRRAMSEHLQLAKRLHSDLENDSMESSNCRPTADRKVDRNLLEHSNSLTTVSTQVPLPVKSNGEVRARSVSNGDNGIRVSRKTSSEIALLHLTKPTFETDDAKNRRRSYRTSPVVGNDNRLPYVRPFLVDDPRDSSNHDLGSVFLFLPEYSAFSNKKSAQPVSWKKSKHVQTMIPTPNTLNNSPDDNVTRQSTLASKTHK